MNVLDVYCAVCLAPPSEPCTTMSGANRSPHAPRAQLASHPDACAQLLRCGPDYGEPCRRCRDLCPRTPTEPG